MDYQIEGNFDSQNLQLMQSLTLIVTFFFHIDTYHIIHISREQNAQAIVLLPLQQF